MKMLRLTTVWLTIVFVTLSTPTIAQLNADFSANIKEDCSPLIVSFTDQSTGNPTSWHWEFGNGNSSSQEDPGAIYVNPGDYTVTLIVSNGSKSDTITKTNYLTVFQDPVADFTVDQTKGCTPFTADFTSQSQLGSVGIQDYSWDFGNGSDSFIPNPSETYNNAGNYSVTHLVVDSNGCKDEKSVSGLIEVADNPQAKFSGQPNTACEPPLALNLTNKSSGSSLSYNWDFGNGSSSTDQNPSESYTSYGSYDVGLTVQDTFGCQDSVTKTDFVTIEELNASFSVNKTAVCAPGNVQFSDLTSPTPAQLMWDFGDGSTSSQQNPSHTYDSTGSYTVTLVAQTNTGCSDTLTKQNYITIKNPPKPDFSANDTSACSVPFTVQFTDQSPNAVDWTWTFGDGDSSNLQNPSHTYTQPGKYTVSLTVTNNEGCQETYTKANYISIVEPEAGFDADKKKGCVSLPVNFTDKSTSNQPITSWTWDFGDGSTSTSQNPSHTYSAEGKYDVSLTIENTAGCIDTLKETAYIEAGDTPSVDFTANPTTACLNEGVDFTSQGSGGDQYFWSFGDGGVSTDENPSYEYGDTGKFTVTHIILNNGCPDTMIKEDYIHIYPPNAVFSVVQSCTDPYTINLNDQSLDPDHWEWTFSDGDTVNGPSPAPHTFDTTGEYSVGLTVLDTVSGCRKEETKTFTIADPEASFTADTTIGCAPLSVSFIDSSVDADSYQWMTDSNSFNGANPSFTYQEPGTYDVKLIITDQNGCEDTMMRNDYITVNGPSAGFSATPRDGCAPLTVQFNDTSSAFNGNVTSYQWVFGDGDTSYAEDPIHTYQEPGSYDVTLTVFDNNGCSQTIKKSNFIEPTFPNPAFTGDTLTCSGQTVSFSNQSTGKGMSYSWQFGDGDTSTVQNPVHSYDSEGQYDVSLTVTDVNGCDTTVSKPDYVAIEDPRADFYADSTFAPCPPFLVNFNDSSSSDIVSWEWHFGDGATSAKKNPSHVYDAPGDYDVTLITTSKFGCKDTMKKEDFTVVLGPNGSFTYNPKVGCEGMEVDFEATTTNTAKRTWDFGDGNVKVDGDTTSHVYNTPGVYHPVLILDDGLGCTYSVESDDSVTVGGINANFSANKQYLCKSGTVQFGDLSSGFPSITSHKWYFGNGDSSSLADPSYTYTTPGVYDVTLVVSNGICEDTMTKQNFITVDDGPHAAFGISVEKGCMPLKVQFTDSTVADSTITSWQWDFDNGSTSAKQNPSQTFTSAGTYQVELIVTSNAGCPDTVTKPVTVHPLPNADAGGDQTICLKDSAQLNASGGVSYSWTPVTGLSNPASASPMASPSTTTIYEVLVTDANGCQAKDSVKVTVNPLPEADAGPSYTICKGDAAMLNASGGSSYNWSNAGVLSDASVADPTAVPQSSTTFNVTVIDTNGCSAMDSTQVQVNPLPQADAGPDYSICMGSAAQLNASGGVDYSWSPGATLSDSTIANPTSLPKNTTTYHVTVTDSNGCSASDSAIVSIDTLPVADAGNNQTICYGDSAQLDASGGVSYEWTPSNGLGDTAAADPKASPSTTTTYEVLVTNANGCKDRDSVTVSVNPLPKADAGPSYTICEGSAAQLNASGGSTYSWSDAGLLSDASVANPTAVPTSTTTFNVTVTDSNGCSAVDSTQVHVNPLPPADAGPAYSVCIGDAAQLNASGGISYQWSPSQNMNNANSPTPTVLPKSTTTYHVTVTDTNGCSANDSTTVTTNPLPVADAGKDTAICNGQAYELNASGGSSYSWSPSTHLSMDSTATPIASPQTTTTYEVTVTDSNGCTDRDEVKIQVNPLPKANAGSNQDICMGDSVQLSGSGTGKIVNWSPSSTLTCSNCDDPLAYPTDTTEYVVKVEDSNRCVAEDTMQVNVNDLPTGVAYPDTVICDQESVVLHAEGGVEYKWTPAKGLSDSTSPNPVASPSKTKQYSVKITNSNDCFIYDTVDVTVNPLPKTQNQISDDQVICEGDSAQLSIASGYDYNWDPSASLSCDTCSEPVATPSATTTYTVTTKTAKGCAVKDTTKVTVNPVPEVDAGKSTTICKGSDKLLSASSPTATDFQWTPAASLASPSSQETKATPADSTVYQVEAENQYNCSATDRVRVNVVDKVSVSLQNDTSICIGDTLQLKPDVLQKGEQDVHYTWQPASRTGNNQASKQVVAPKESVEYQLIAESGSCKADTQSTQVEVNKLPEVDLGEDRIAIRNAEVPLKAETNEENRIEWMDNGQINCIDCKTNTVQLEQSSEFRVEVTDRNQCVNADTVNVEILKTCEGEIYVPNTFTPNGDDRNDVLYVRGRTLQEVKTFRVFNRWGELMYEGDSKNEGWDGRHRGKTVNPGVYVYRIEAVCNNGSVVKKKGNITIVK